MIAPTAIRDWEKLPEGDRPRYREAIKRIIKNDPRAKGQMKAMAQAGSDWYAMFGVHKVIAMKASREHRMFLSHEGVKRGEIQLLAFAHRGDNRYYRREA